MIANDFKEKYKMYENMEIWEISNVEDFFKADEMLREIFEKEYGFSYTDRNDSDKKLQDTDVQVVSKLLDYFGDKYFFVFTNHDPNHDILKALQDKKIVHFGIDIHVIHPQKIYVLEMNKTKDLKAYDTI